jgi:hypothetical protein
VRWVIGDIHGLLRPLQVLLEAVRRHDARPLFLFAGDYVNRGPDSKGVIELLLSLEADGTARFVRGNHDDMFDCLLRGHTDADPAEVGTPDIYLTRFVQNGMLETFASYGVDTNEPMRMMGQPDVPRLRKLLTAAVPESHGDFLRRLRLAIDEPDLFVAHARLDPNEPDCSDGTPDLAPKLAAGTALRHDVIWGRFTEWEIRAPKRWRRTGYFGHTPVQALRGSRGVGIVPIRGPGIVLLDTGGVYPGGRLTAVCADEDVFLQVDATGRIVGAD